MTNGWGIYREIALRWISMNPTDDKSTLVQVMAWCRQATSHYLSQCWPRSLSPYGVTRPQWVNTLSSERCGSNFTDVLFKSILRIGNLITSHVIHLRSGPQNPKSTINISSGGGHQAITWTNVDLDVCHHMAKMTTLCMLSFWRKLIFILWYLSTSRWHTVKSLI